MRAAGAARTAGAGAAADSANGCAAISRSCGRRACACSTVEAGWYAIVVAWRRARSCACCATMTCWCSPAIFTISKARLHRAQPADRAGDFQGRYRTTSTRVKPSSTDGGTSFAAIRSSACSGTTRARASVAGLADIERHIEIDGFDFAAVFARQFDERPAVAARQIRRIDVSDRPLEFDPLPQQIAHGGENRRVDGLVVFVVGQLQADRVARNRMGAEARRSKSTCPTRAGRPRSRQLSSERQTTYRPASSSRSAMRRRSAMESTGSYFAKRRSTAILVRSASPSEQAASTGRANISMRAMESRSSTAAHVRCLCRSSASAAAPIPWRRFP